MVPGNMKSVKKLTGKERRAGKVLAIESTDVGLLASCGCRGRCLRRAGSIRRWMLVFASSGHDAQGVHAAGNARNRLWAAARKARGTNGLVHATRHGAQGRSH